ncbi:MAG: type II toxin-antitoxin system VapB family antitoxin [Methylococcaceae bacterium]|nr:type II toxin-antitoxin system VapB family antitoxin [Methylococcaceae bacterium]
MRTLNIDDDLYAKAITLTGVHKKTVLLREGLKALVERESAQRLALLGGSDPDLKQTPPRRQSALEKE